MAVTSKLKAILYFAGLILKGVWAFIDPKEKRRKNLEKLIKKETKLSWERRLVEHKLKEEKNEKEIDKLEDRLSYILRTLVRLRQEIRDASRLSD